MILNFLLSATISSLFWVRSMGDLDEVSVDHYSREYSIEKEKKKCDALKLSVCPGVESVPKCGFLIVSASVPHYGNFIGNWNILLDSVRVPVQFSSVSVSGNRSAVGVKIVPLSVCPSLIRVVDLGGKFVEFRAK